MTPAMIPADQRAKARAERGPLQRLASTRVVVTASCGSGLSEADRDARRSRRCRESRASTRIRHASHVPSSASRPSAAMTAVGAAIVRNPVTAPSASAGR